MSICIKVGFFLTEGEPHVCRRSFDGYVRIWCVHTSIVEVHSLDTKKVTVIA